MGDRPDRPVGGDRRRSPPNAAASLFGFARHRTRIDPIRDLDQKGCHVVWIEREIEAPSEARRHAPQHRHCEPVGHRRISLLPGTHTIRRYDHVSSAVTPPGLVRPLDPAARAFPHCSHRRLLSGLAGRLAPDAQEPRPEEHLNGTVPPADTEHPHPSPNGTHRTAAAPFQDGRGMRGHHCPSLQPRSQSSFNFSAGRFGTGPAIVASYLHPSRGMASTGVTSRAALATQSSLQNQRSPTSRQPAS